MGAKYKNLTKCFIGFAQSPALFGLLQGGGHRPGAGGAVLLLKKGGDLSGITRKTAVPDEVEAPVKKGEAAGELIYMKDGKELGSIRILYGGSVRKAQYRDCLREVLDLICL